MAVPGGGSAAGAQVGGGLAGLVVPQDQDGQVRQSQGCGALDGRGQPALGVAGAQEVLAVLDRLFDGLITTGKFCCTRWGRLQLNWSRRPVWV